MQESDKYQDLSDSRAVSPRESFESVNSALGASLLFVVPQFCIHARSQSVRLARPLLLRLGEPVLVVVQSDVEALD